MAEVTAVTQGVQLGIETTPGTVVAAGVKLPSIALEPSIKANVDTFRASGAKVNTLAALGKEWSEWKLTGKPTYDELAYLLDSLLAASTASTSDTTAKTRAYAPATFTPDTVKTFTIEQGDAVRAKKAAYGIVSELQLDWTRDAFDLSGTVLARAISDGITLTATPTSIAQVPVLAKDCDVYLDTTGAGVGTTQLTRVKKWSLKLANRQIPFFAADSSQGSFIGTVEGPIDASLEVTVEADAAGMALLPVMRTGARRFFEAKFTSATLAGAATVPYSLKLDVAGAVNDAGQYATDEGLYVIPWTFDVEYDATWAKWLAATLVNKTATL